MLVCRSGYSSAKTTDGPLGDAAMEARIVAVASKSKMFSDHQTLASEILDVILFLGFLKSLICRIQLAWSTISRAWMADQVRSLEVPGDTSLWLPMHNRWPQVRYHMYVAILNLHSVLRLLQCAVILEGNL